MTVHFDSFHFGEVMVNGRAYGDVLVIADQVKLRDEARLEKIGGHHLVGPWEADELLSNRPEVVIIGNGTAGVLRAGLAIKERCQKAKVELVILTTPQAIREYNALVKMGKKVNALIHVTC